MYNSLKWLQQKFVKNQLNDCLLQSGPLAQIVSVCFHKISYSKQLLLRDLSEK